MSEVVGMLTSDQMMAGLCAQRSEGVLCDVELEAEGKVILAYRAVLAAASPYFHAMFTGDFKEKHEKVIRIKEFGFDSLSAVINCIYKLKLEVTNKTVAEVLAVANLLQITGIINECEQLMIKRISKPSCLEFLNLAEMYSLDKMTKVANDFILKHFIELSMTDGFKKISKEKLCRYLSDDTLNFKNNEAEIFKAAEKWLVADDERLSCTEEVMKCVRFMLINPDDLNAIGELSIISESKECQKLVRNALVYHSKPNEQPLYDSAQNRPRGRKDILIISGSESLNGLFKNARTETTVHYNAVGEHAVTSNSVKKTFTFAFVCMSLSAVQKNNFLFVFGTDNTSFTPISMRYNASTSEWKTLVAVPRQGTIGSVATFCGDDILLIGGLYVKEDAVLKYSVGNLTAFTSKYSIRDNQWRILPDCPLRFASGAACSHGLNAYVSGGRDEQKEDSALHCFDSVAALWLTKPSMNCKRVEHMMVCVGDKLYAIGGRTFDNHLVKDVEIFDVFTEQWTVVQDLSVPCSRAFAFVDGTKIYITGGSQKSSSRRKKVGFISFIETAKNCIVRNHTHLQDANISHVGGMLIIPELL